MIIHERRLCHFALSPLSVQLPWLATLGPAASKQTWLPSAVVDFSWTAFFLFTVVGVIRARTCFAWDKVLLLLLSLSLNFSLLFLFLFLLHSSSAVATAVVGPCLVKQQDLEISVL